MSEETRDSNGTLLADGDTVTLIKDLKVKGSGELAGWQARPCVSCTTAQMSASAAAQVSLCMRSALKDDLRPRRLFEASASAARAEAERSGGQHGPNRPPWPPWPSRRRRNAATTGG